VVARGKEDLVEVISTTRATSKVSKAAAPNSSLLPIIRPI